MDSFKNKSLLIKAEASRLGFSGCGISKACELSENSKIFSQWLEAGFHAGMDYMARNTEKRSNPQLLVENAQSVISVILNYFPQQIQSSELPQISKYAYGLDYHQVIKQKLSLLFDYINIHIQTSTGRFFTDSGPVLERAWAHRAGLGWIGKNSCLINKKYGSWFFIGELILDIELDYDQPVKNYCGTCTKCLDACPTQAILPNKTINSNRCISYHTIENKGEIPEFMKGKMNNYIFGCDICQDVCPWNQKPITTAEKDFLNTGSFMKMSFDDFVNTEKNQAKNIIKNYALERTKISKIKRNIDFIKQ